MILFNGAGEKRAPMTIHLIADYVDKCSFPPRVFNLVNGNRVVVEASMHSPIVKGVSIIDLTPAYKIIAERSTYFIQEQEVYPRDD